MPGEVRDSEFRRPAGQSAVRVRLRMGRGPHFPDAGHRASVPHEIRGSRLQGPQCHRLGGRAEKRRLCGDEAHSRQSDGTRGPRPLLAHEQVCPESAPFQAARRTQVQLLFNSHLNTPLLTQK